MLTVLIVDDERYIREGLREFIDWRGEGFHIVGESEDGEDAYAQIRDRRPDVVLCDIRMPHMDGLALVDRVRTEVAKPPVFIILSGYGDFSYAQRALRLGVSNYLLKPVQRDELLAELQRIRRLENESGKAAGKDGITAPALDLILRAPPADHLSEALGLSLATTTGAETCAYRYVATRCDSTEDLIRLMREIESWFACNDLSFARRTHATVLDCVHVRGHSFRGATLREVEDAVLELCESLRAEVRVFRGPRVQGVTRAHESLTGLDKAMINAFYVDAPFTYRVDPAPDYGYDPYPLARIQGISQCIASLSVDAIDREINDIDASLRANPVQPDTVIGAANSLLVDVLRIVAEREGSIEELEKHTGGTPQIDISLGLSGLLSRLRSYAEAAVEYLRSIHSDTRNQIVRDIEFYVDQHLTDRLRVKDLAKRLGLHPYYLGRLFKEQTGITITDYVHSARVEAAKRMLVNRQATLSDVAAWVGYHDAEYFSRKFKEIVGVSPRAYRERNQ
ncbi:MAG TPA: response regulator [Spirochaetia bacterium]|nr:response regulator [Spirochaetia bacterium]